MGLRLFSALMSIRRHKEAEVELRTAVALRQVHWLTVQNGGACMRCFAKRLNWNCLRLQRATRSTACIYATFLVDGAARFTLVCCNNLCCTG